MIPGSIVFDVDSGNDGSNISLRNVGTVATFSDDISDVHLIAELFVASPHLANSLSALLTFLETYPHPLGMDISSYLEDAQKALDMVPKNI